MAKFARLAKAESSSVQLKTPVSSASSANETPYQSMSTKEISIFFLLNWREALTSCLVASIRDGGEGRHIYRLYNFSRQSRCSWSKTRWWLFHSIASTLRLRHISGSATPCDSSEKPDIADAGLPITISWRPVNTLCVDVKMWGSPLKMSVKAFQ